MLWGKKGHLVAGLKKYASSAVNGRAASTVSSAASRLTAVWSLSRCLRFADDLCTSLRTLDAFNFDLAQTLIHRVHAGVVDGCVVVTGAGGGYWWVLIDTAARPWRAHSFANALCLLEVRGPRLLAPLRLFAAICRATPWRLLSRRQHGGVVLSDGFFCRRAQSPGMGFRGSLQLVQIPIETLLR